LTSSAALAASGSPSSARAFSSDWNEQARITYEANHRERPHGDIHTVAVADIPTHDILCAGFPCQPFSIAGVSKKLSLGKKHGFEDKEQGNLFFTLADIIDYHRPTAFVLENVKNLRSHDQGRTFQIIHDTLTKALGYTAYYQVIDARSVVPQHREIPSPPRPGRRWRSRMRCRAQLWLQGTARV
jgi:DNA (cytosine-5)-methyltransferase 1